MIFYYEISLFSTELTVLSEKKTLQKLFHLVLKELFVAIKVRMATRPVTDMTHSRDHYRQSALQIKDVRRTTCFQTQHFQG